jgi:hypothetical protein
MALRKTGNLKDSIATPSGIKDKDGKMLIVNDNSFYIHSKEFMDNWNKPAKPKKKAVVKKPNKVTAPGIGPRASKKTKAKAERTLLQKAKNIFK